MEETLDLRVDRKLQTYPWFAVFDFESVLSKIPLNRDNDSDPTTQWTTEHVPICVSIASNIPEHTNPHCIIDTNPDNLVKRMCDYLDQLQSFTEQLAKERWSTVFNELEKLRVNFSVEPMDGNDDNNDNEREETVEDLFGDNDPEYLTEMDIEDIQKLHTKRVDSLSTKFKKYAEALPVLGFNSSRYDLNLIKKHFPKHLNLVTEADFIIKKCNQYSVIATSKFRFLDISNFLAAGCSYSKFLQAYDIPESKSFFPYEWFDDVTKLEDEALPPYEAFESKLKNANVLEIEFTNWVKDGRRGPQPKNGVEKYRELLDIWQERQMRSFSDFLEYYVNLDTGPFVQAAEKLMDYYFKMGVDVWKDTFSAPGVARKLLFKHAKKSNIHFASFSEEDADLYHRIKKSAFGGPSIIFNRYAKVGETYIRNNEEVICKSILGYDCNSLYLQAIGDLLPVMMPIRRLEETNFKPKVSWKYIEAYEWLNWVSKSQGIYIQHKMNTGQEFPVGPYKLDGYAVVGNRKIALEFDGCWTHGHSPDVCGFRKDRETPQDIRELLAKKDKRTQTRAKYIKSRGYELISIYECEFADIKKENPRIKEIINDMLPEFYLSHPYGVRKETILRCIESGELTGLVEVDIQVPETWPYDKERDISPQEYFSEMSPIFCNSEVHFNHWGPTMQRYSMSKKADAFTETRRLLIGGMAAKRIFLATNLLKWYLERGLVVTRIYEVVEYKFKTCFKGFCDNISDARRKGDQDSTKEILGETCKVLGNAAYGSLLLDKTKHIKVKYVHGKNDAHLLVNTPRFKKLVELPEEMYEMELSKKVIKLDLPIQLAFCI